MNLMGDQLLLIAAERIKHGRAYNHVNHLEEEYGSAKLFTPKIPGKFIRLTCWLLLLLSRIMFAWSERFLNYSYLIRGRKTRF
jgi:hypothetical protein